MRAVLVALLVFALAACGNGTKLETRTEAVLHASIVATANPGSQRFVDHYDSTTGPNGVVDCSTAASDGNSSQRTFELGAPGTRRAPVYFSIRTRTFSGPGVYRDAAVALDSAGATIARRVVWFVREPTSHVTLTLHDDGSGSASFSGYRSPQGTTIAATVTWTCTTQTVLFPKNA